MILSGDIIRWRCSNGDMVSPFSERTKVHGLTFGLGPAGYDVRMKEEVSLYPPGLGISFALASTIEQFNMPLDVMGIVHDKSTWARMGIAVQNTVIEPGWRGHLTLELTMHGDSIVRLKSGTPIAQIIFHQLDFNTEAYDGKYQDQPAGAQPAIFEQGTEEDG